MIGPLPYVGGKNRLATKIISMLPEHTTYVEAFAGGAQVLFHKPPSNVVILIAAHEKQVGCRQDGDGDSDIAKMSSNLPLTSRR